MSYHFSKTCSLPFEDTVAKVTEVLAGEGFIVLTEVDFQKIFKDKLDVEFRRYRAMGVSNPSFTHAAISAEDKAGTMLPYNVIVQEIDGGKVEVSAVDPVASLMAVHNPQLGAIAHQVSAKLERVIKCL